MGGDLAWFIHNLLLAKQRGGKLVETVASSQACGGSVQSVWHGGKS